ncbi:uncharacterized domain 1-containing protein [Tenacibaculum sp. MAR_2009_124]|uniref:acyl-CoA thioesterase n=1 Tax=Tenacibaculum sp. MAR_2009_124 TaxID=1250059 RepID=UPI000898FD3B|nr:acyl-CoA thioesterase [Tenacibaculum sp. MAR_2009_124]SEB40068.1 uncharacterized domain 1-containing protein [Tenacibaculum sp. MAR_2009_124]
MKNKFVNVEDTRISITELMLPAHANFSGKIHGGYVLNLMDQIAFACASKHSATYCVTASVDTVDFLNPIEVGELVTMRASINFVGKTSMVVGIRVESQNIQTGKVNHCNSSYFTMVAKDENGKGKAVPGIIINDEIEMRRFLKAVKRIEMKKKRQEEFDSKDFIAHNYIKDLEAYNVKIEL